MPLIGDEDDPDWTRLERLVLPLIRHGRTRRTALAGVLFSGVVVVVFLSVVLLDASDSVLLGQRGQVAEARVVRVNDDGDGPSVNVVFTSGPVGEEALIDRLVSAPRTGEILAVLYDREQPGRAIDARAPLWQWGDLAGLVPSLLGGVIFVAEWRHWRRLRRRGDGRHRRLRHR